MWYFLIILTYYFYSDGNYNSEHSTIKIKKDKIDLLLHAFCKSELESKVNTENTNKQNKLVSERSNYTCQHSKICDILQLQ